MPQDRADTCLLDIVIVVSTGAREHLRVCLKSIERHPLTIGPASIKVTDNASRDGTVEMVRDDFPRVRVEAFEADSGFPRANNVWLRRSGAPFALLLNPDTELTDGALDHMVELMRRRPDVGVAGCRLVLRDGSLDHAAKRSFPTPLSALAHFTGIGRRAGAGRRLAQYRAPELEEHGCDEVDSVNGAFMLVRHEAMREVGLLDEGYPTPGMEDLDWCFRFKRRGWKVWYEGAVTVVHVKGGMTVEQRGRVRHRGLRHNLSFHRSMGRFYRKWYAGKNPLMDLAVYLAIGAKFVVAAVRSAVARRSLI
ncbi:MAG: glycosyltransferase family 2 protein [Actinomycetota bacterium]